MNMPLTIARRYLFGKKSTNAINVITGISVIGIAIGTAALILILSVFNGFEQYMMKYLDRFNPDLKIESTEGKYFDINEELLAELRNIVGVASISYVIEEVALLEYNDQQQIGIIKGVDSVYLTTTELESALQVGDVKVDPEGLQHYATVGYGIYSNLGISLRNKVMSLKIFLPNRKKSGPLDKDFRSRSLTVSGVFRVNNERDHQYVITDYEVVSNLLALSGQASALEVKANSPEVADDIQAAIISKLPDDYRVLDRYQQDESFLKIMNIEKWSSYLILTFTLLLIIFNIVGCLWMIVLEKRKDISVLQAIGASKQTIKKIFLYEGGLIASIGFGIGFLFAVIFYILQKTVGIITVPDGYSITAYPMELEPLDVLLVLVTVMVLGILASVPAARRAARVSAYVRTE